MAILGRWTGGVVALLPTETFTAPVNLFPTQARNDGTAYSFTSATSILTLPSSDLADGYLLVGRFEFRDTSNGRFNPQGRIIQASGTGDFVGGPTGGYSRDTSEDRAYVSCFSFINNPSASSTFQFEWKRDVDSPNGGTVRSSFDVIPLFYADVGLYTSTDATLLGGTTPNVVGSWSTTLEGTNITRSSDIITLTGDNKRYLIFASQFFDGGGSGRTQRWHGLDIDGTQENAAKSYSFYRDSNNDESGNMFSHLLETNTDSITIEQTCYRGDGVLAGEGGAVIDGFSHTTGEHVIVALELNSAAEVFHSVDDLGGIDLNVTGPVDQTIARTTGITFNDAASWTRSTDTAINSEVAMDALLGANISAAQEVVSTTTRWTAQARLTVNGTEDDDVFHGNYARNMEGTGHTFGWSAPIMGFAALAEDDTVGVSVQELSGGEDGGQFEVQVGWSGFWGINLDTLESVVTSNITASLAEAGDTTVSTLKALVSITATLSEDGDTTSASIVLPPASITALLNEAGDITLAVLLRIIPAIFNITGRFTIRFANEDRLIKFPGNNRGIEFPPDDRKINL